ncbi:MAG TPA: biotin transporter BioY [Longimicrobiales bacterium]|nr:biotin transporter BioY [Longimicrobiales bacterium]
MNNVQTQIRRATHAEVLTSVPARRLFAVMTFTLLTAFSAHVSAPLPGTAVPVSLQTLVVLLSGMLLGPALGAAAQTAYLMAGAAGLPVFAAGFGLPYLFGPTGGYLLAFPAAAAVAGAVAVHAQGGTARRVAMLTLAGALATLTVYAGGTAQLTLLTGDPAGALRLGVLPFIIGDLAKLALAVVLALRIRRRTLALL